MKFLIVMVFAQTPMAYDVSPIAGPYDSINQCEAQLSQSLGRGEQLIRAVNNSLVKLASPPVQGVFSKCIPYNPNW